MEGATARKKIEITVQTERLMLIRRRGISRRWCESCGCEVDVVNFAQAQVLTGIGQQTLRDGAPAVSWHCLEAADGSRVVCLQSLLKSM